MRITVIGPGAVGTLLGGLCAAAGHEVAFRGREPRSDRRRIRIVLPGGWKIVDTARWAGGEGPAGAQDLVLVTLGRHHLHAIRRPDFLHKVGKGECPVVFFNADPPDLERLGLAAGRQVLGLTVFTAVKLQEGDVELCPGKAIVLHEQCAPLSACLSSLQGLGIQVQVVRDAAPLLNSLFLSQLLALPAAMCNSTLDAFLSWPEGRSLALDLLQEGFAALEKANMPVAALPASDPADLVVRLGRKAWGFDGAALLPDRAYSSVLQSYLTGRPTEAAHLNRRVVEIGSSAGLHLTWNWRLLQKSSRVSGLGFYRDPADLLHSLQ